MTGHGFEYRRFEYFYAHSIRFARDRLDKMPARTGSALALDGDEKDDSRDLFEAFLNREPSNFQASR